MAAGRGSKGAALAVAMVDAQVEPGPWKVPAAWAQVKRRSCWQPDVVQQAPVAEGVMVTWAVPRLVRDWASVMVRGMARGFV